MVVVRPKVEIEESRLITLVTFIADSAFESLLVAAFVHLVASRVGASPRISVTVPAIFAIQAASALLWIPAAKTMDATVTFADPGMIQVFGRQVSVESVMVPDLSSAFIWGLQGLLGYWFLRIVASPGPPRTSP